MTRRRKHPKKENEYQVYVNFDDGTSSWEDVDAELRLEGVEAEPAAEPAAAAPAIGNMVSLWCSATMISSDGVASTKDGWRNPITAAGASLSM